MTGESVGIPYVIIFLPRLALTLLRDFHDFPISLSFTARPERLQFFHDIYNDSACVVQRLKLAKICEGFNLVVWITSLLLNGVLTPLLCTIPSSVYLLSSTFSIFSYFLVCLGFIVVALYYV